MKSLDTNKSTTQHLNYSLVKGKKVIENKDSLTIELLNELFIAHHNQDQARIYYLDKTLKKLRYE